MVRILIFLTCINVTFFSNPLNAVSCHEATAKSSFKSSVIDQIFSLLSEDIDHTYQNEFLSLSDIPRMTPIGRNFREASKRHREAHAAHTHSRSHHSDALLKRAEKEMREAWELLKQEGQSIVKKIVSKAKTHGINIKEKSIQYNIAEGIDVTATQLIVTKKGNHPINKLAALLSKLEINPVKLVIQPSLVAQGHRGVYNSLQKKLFVEPAVILNATLSDQSMIHEIIHLLLSELIATKKAHPMWEMSFQSWSIYSRLPGNTKFYPKYMSVQELITFWATGVRALYHLGELEGQISKRERDYRLQESIKIFEATKFAAERIRLVADLVQDVKPKLMTSRRGSFVKARISQHGSGIDDVRFDVFQPIDTIIENHRDVPKGISADFYQALKKLSSIAIVLEEIAIDVLEKLKNDNGRRVAMDIKEFERILRKTKDLDLPIPIETLLSGK